MKIVYAREAYVKLFEQICPVPKVCDTAEGDWRRMHADLAVLSPAELALEAERTRFRLLVEDPPNEWVVERMHYIREVQRRRG